MDQFLSVFFLTLLVGLVSNFVFVAAALFGPWALFLSPEWVPYAVAVSLAVGIVAPMGFIAWIARKWGPAWLACLSGMSALPISYLLFWFLVYWGF